MNRPYSVDMIVEMLRGRGDGREVDAIRVHVIRAIESGALAKAYKVNPRKQTSPWLVPVESVEAWINAG